MPICAPSEPTFVTMKSGLAVSISALRVLWRLEETGMIVKLDNDTGRLLVGPQSRLECLVYPLKLLCLFTIWLFIAIQLPLSI